MVNAWVEGVADVMAEVEVEARAEADVAGRVEG